MFEIACPWGLALIPLPWLIWWAFPRKETLLPAALKVPFFNAMLGILETERVSELKQTKMTLLFLVWSLTIFALAGPRWVGEPQHLTHEGYNLMLALDISGSMEMNDRVLHGRAASRLDVVKQAARQFVEDRPGDRIGLILFASQAYLQTPLTYDRHTVLLRLEDSTVGLAGKTTSIGDALGLAVKRLQSVPKKGRMIILLTDGVNNSGVLAPLKAAELARDDEIKVYTIGLGAATDSRIGGLFFNMNMAADLDEETLKEIAKMTGGRYFRATDLASLQDIYKTINQMETISQEQPVVRPQHDYYPWPLAMAVLLFFYWFAEQNSLVQSVSRYFPRLRRSETPL